MNRNKLTIPVLMIGFFWLSGVLAAQGGKVYVKVKKENLRQSPNGEKIGELVSGSQVEVLEKRANWTKVQVTAWVWDGSLDADSTQVDGFQIRVSHILVQSEASAQLVQDRLSKGDAFEAVAREISTDKGSAAKGGDLGLFGRGDLMPEFEKTAFALKVGQVSKAVKTDLGYHIIKRIK
ncbi:peptidylprolyl isomerase [candidate division KSB1 bacterium]|nr:peptidylprolyl isomerase [candidate division KSB1 bacterium]